MEIRSFCGEILFAKDGEELDICELFGVDLRQADLRGFDFQMIMLEKVNMAGADLSGASLYWCVLIKVNLEGANLEGANLRGTGLAYVNFRGANLRNADLGPSYLGGPTSIRASDFTGANLEGAKLTDALYDAEVKFPEGFSPSDHKMVLRNLGGPVADPEPK